MKMNKSKKWLGRVLLLLTVLMLVMPLGASAASVKLNKTKLTLNKGKSYTLRINNTTKKVTWKSSKKSVATVSSSGKVVAKKKGTATITATVGSKQYRCKVTVKQPVTSVKLNLSGSILVTEGRKYNMLKVKVGPTSANNKALQWSSSNKKVVTVNSKGELKAVKPGTAVITVKTKDGSGKKDTCKVYVKAKMNSSDAQKVMEISKPVLKLEVGKSQTLTVSNTGGNPLIWATGNKAIATVKDGKVTAVKAGKTLITAKPIGSDQSVSCYVTVTDGSDQSVSEGGSVSAKRFLSILDKYSKQVQKDKANGIKWGYSNSGSLALSTWSKAYSASRSKGISYCNCALLARWALREMGIIDSKNFWGLAGGGIQFRGDVKQQLLKHCEIIPVYQTPNQLLAQGKLLPGDICTYVDYQHTNVYAGNGLWYDSGRNSAVGSYKNGTFIFNSFGPAATVSMSNTTIGHIIRIVK